MSLYIVYLLVGLVCYTAVEAGPGIFSDGQRFLFGSNFGVPANASFDYAVVGGGTAALTVAARLSENYSVAVIEAGSFYEIGNGSLSQIPLYDAYFVGKDPSDYNPLVDWEFVTTPQMVRVPLRLTIWLILICLQGALNKSSLYSRGKTLGGCSARNYMAYHRGTRQEYEKWARQVGDDSYTFDNWLPFFEKSLNYTPVDPSKRAENANWGLYQSRLRIMPRQLHLGFRKASRR